MTANRHESVTLGACQSVSGRDLLHSRINARGSKGIVVMEANEATKTFPPFTHIQLLHANWPHGVIALASHTPIAETADRIHSRSMTCMAGCRCHFSDVCGSSNALRRRCHSNYCREQPNILFTGICTMPVMTGLLSGHRHDMERGQIGVALCHACVHVMYDAALLQGFSLPRPSK